MNKYESPFADSLLLDQGFIRCNEAPVYLSSFENGYGKGYQFTFPMPGNNVALTDALINQSKLSRSILGAFFKSTLICGSVNVTYNADKLLECVLMITADFYYHEWNREKHLEYVRLYERVSGKSYAMNNCMIP